MAFDRENINPIRDKLYGEWSAAMAKSYNISRENTQIMTPEQLADWGTRYENAKMEYITIYINVQILKKIAKSRLLVRTSNP